MVQRAQEQHEPLLRLNLEAKDKKTLDKMLATIAPKLGVKVDH